MTKLITIAIVVVLLYGGWQFFLYWDRVKNEKETQEKAAATPTPPLLRRLDWSRNVHGSDPSRSRF